MHQPCLQYVTTMFLQKVERLVVWAFDYPQFFCSCKIFVSCSRLTVSVHSVRLYDNQESPIRKILFRKQELSKLYWTESVSLISLS